MTERRQPFGASTALAVNGTDHGASNGGPFDPSRNEGRLRSGSARRRPAARHEVVLVAVVAVLGALLSMLLSDAAPTATPWIDAVERGLFVALVALAASRARRWTLVVGSVLVTLAAPWPLLMVGVACLGVSVFQVETRTRNRTVGAVTGAAVALLSLGLSVPGPTGIETAVAVAATAPILASGYRRAMSDARRYIRRTVLVLAIVFAVSMVVTLVAGAMAAGKVDSAIDLTNRAVEAAEEGAGGESAALFEEANEAFVAANATIGSPWASGPRFLPVVGANLAAIQRAVGAGVDLTEAGTSLVSGAEFEEVQLDDGGVDLVALEALSPRVEQAGRVLGDAQATIDSAGSVWLLGPLSERLSQVGERLGTTAHNADNAVVAVKGLPALLGADGPRRYLFLFGNPAESRDMGGHIGNWAEVVADGGRVELMDVGGPLELSMPELSEGFAERFPASFTDMDPARSPQNLGATPDLPLASEVAAELFKARTGRAVDGVAYADVEAFAAMLEVAGLVEVQTPSGPVALGPDNAVEFLTRGQYEVFDSADASGDALEVVIETTFDRLTTMKLPGPQRLGELFGPLVRDGRFQIYSLLPDDTSMLEHFNLDGAVPEPDGSEVLGVFNRNVGPNKIDSFLERDVSAVITWDPTTGAMGSTVTVKLRNTAPVDLTNELIGGNITASPTGTNVTEVVVLSPFRLQTLRVDGLDTAPQPLKEGNLWRYAVRVAVAPQDMVTVSYRLIGQIDAGADYRLRYVGQPLVNDGALSVSLDPLKGKIVSMSVTKGGDPDGSGAEFEFRSSQASDAAVTWRVEDSS